MNNKEYAGVVLREPAHTLSSADRIQTKKFVRLIDEANGVFCADAGRSGFQVKGSAMHLMHMGVASYVAGETCTPNVKEGDVPAVCSGSGGTKSLVNHTARAKEMRARVALITINPNFSIANTADVITGISVPSPKNVRQGDIKSIQPMGSLSEQGKGIFMNIAVMMLMERKGKDPDTMFGRHANVEQYNHWIMKACIGD